MNNVVPKNELKVEQVVKPRKDLGGVQSTDGFFRLRDEIGIGVIREIEPDGKMLVHWSNADFDAWVYRDEVEPLDLATRLITIYEQDGHARRIFKRTKLEAREGLDHNWEVELFPNNVVRTIRQDGAAWTFDWYPLYDRAYPIHTLEERLPTDDQAEALTAAEVALTPEPIV